MTSDSFKAADVAAQVDSLLERLRKDAEKRGWQFLVAPPPHLTPEFLEGYAPDALAIGPDGGTVIDIKTRQSGAQGVNLAEIAKLVRAREGWEFRVFHIAPFVEGKQELPAPTAAELSLGIAEARMLLEGGHERAGLVIAWSLLEAVARLVMPAGEGLGGFPLPPIVTVQSLAEMGYLREVDARRLRALATLRNIVVHGNLAVVVPAEDVARLIRDLEGIVRTLDEAA